MSRIAGKLELGGVALLLAGAAVWIAARRWGWAADDVFITYRYAQNFAQGEGFAFNPGERVFGTTEPGIGLLLAALHRVSGVAIPALGTLLTAASVVTIALCRLGESGAARRERIAAAVGGGLLVGLPLVWAHQGAAATVVAAFVVVAARLRGSRPGLAGAVAGAAFWLRPDAALGVAAVGLDAWIESRRFPLRFAVAAGLAIGAALAWGVATFGSALPATLEVKRLVAMRVSVPRDGIHFWSSAWPFVRRTSGPFAMVVVAASAPALAALAGGRERGGRALAWTAIGLAVAYPLLGVPFMNWYLLPVAIAVCAGLPVLVARAGAERRASSFPGRALRGLAVALGAVAIASLAIGNVRFFVAREPPPRQALYREAAGWLAARANPGDRVASTEVGTIAFYGDLRVLDLSGLVSPEALPFLADRDLLGLLAHHPVRFVLVRGERSRLAPLVARRWFAKRYAPVARWTSARGESLVAYELRGRASSAAGL